MYLFKNPFTISSEFSQIVSLVLFLVSLLSLVDCSNRPEYVKRSNSGEVGSSYVKFNWKEILPLNEYVITLFPYRSEKFPGCFKILLPRDTTVKDYVAVITDKLDKTNTDKASVESQLKELFKKSAFELGIKGIVTPVTIKEDLMLLVNVLFNCFELNDEKYVRREKRKVFNGVNKQMLAQSLLNSLISTDKPAFEASVYLPKGMNAASLVRKCTIEEIYDSFMKKYFEQAGITITGENVKIVAKFILKRVFSSIEKSGNDSQLCKLSEIMTELKTYGLNKDGIITKDTCAKFTNANFYISIESVSNYYAYMEKIYVIITDVGSINARYHGGYLALEYFTKINNSLSISGKDEIEAFPKLIAAALSAEPSQRQIFYPDVEPNKNSLFHAMTQGSLAEMEEFINEAFEHCISEEIDDFSDSDYEIFGDMDF